MDKLKSLSIRTTFNAHNIQNMLPKWDTKVVEVHNFDDGTGYELFILIPAKTASEAKRWVREYEDLTKCSYSIRSTKICSGLRVKFKQRLNCKHNTGCATTYNPAERKKTRNTNCSSIIEITLRSVKRRYRGKDKSKAPDPEFPCEIRLNPVHNHTVTGAGALRFRNVKEETRQKLLNLFECGHSPSTALKSLKIDIQLNSDNYQEILSDRALCPDYMYCYHLYKTHFKKKYRPEIATQEYLERRIKQYNEIEENSARIKFIGEDFVISFCPLLMKRIHMYVEHAAHVVFVSSLVTPGPHASRVLILSTISECGGVPLGIIMFSSDDEHIINCGFQLLQDILGDTIFGGSIDGPSFVIINDSLLEEIPFQSVWPESHCLLSTFHVLRSVWRWLINSKPEIQLDDQQIMFQQFRTIMFSNDVSECENAFRIAERTALNYPPYLVFLQKYWAQRDLWTLCYRNSLTRYYPVDDSSEAAMRLLQENIFEKIKAFNLLQTLDFMLTKFVTYYEKRLLDAAENCTQETILHQIIEKPSMDILVKIHQVAEHLYLVPCESTLEVFYIVNTEVLICSCFQVRTNSGYICKHTNWTCLYVSNQDFIKPINDEATQNKFYFIAKGSYSLSYEPTQPCDNYDSCLKQDPDVEEDSNSESSSDTESEMQQLVEDGTKLVNDIMESFSEHLKKSPHEVVIALDVFHGHLREIRTVAEFTAACKTFAENHC